ncbi:type II toxin-antitoxin system TacA family antitoxin [Thiorhodovibrio frisius]|uniref:DUF1778 domain-containing protein n=1 Tax=Thiorhodovibrio frisius TaxID=631362 RepID=H8Z686_9GAMM|nr:DUF1778 domain-containing protein [Thiorhodovibrio frisius]EIC19653.1 hypothetical protein Thi970DRAFT_03243 [Thiorhodovibrio frisius]WPL20379.1 hypothetical protein Thiofri_00466 [Thiorhodovibrio frisius]
MSLIATKNSRLHIRCDERTRQLLDKAAAYSRSNLSAFVLNEAVAAAERILSEQESITLQNDDFQAFLAALDTPAVPNAALVRAFERHSEQVIAS